MRRLVQLGFTTWLTAILVCVTAGMIVAGWLYYREQRGAFQQQRADELTGIADLKAGQIEAWRADLIDDGGFLGSGSLGGAATGRLLAADAAPDLERTVTAWIEIIKTARGYSKVALLDAQVKLRISTSREPLRLQSEDVELAHFAMEQNRVTLSDLHRNASGDTRLSLHVPISNPPGNQPVGELLIEIDPLQTLFPLIRVWPSSSPSAESFLVRQEADQFVFLNELRYRKDAAGTVRLPMERTVFSKVKPGTRTVWEARDYRGVEVLATSRRIADSTWILIAKIDLRDVYSPLWRTAIPTAVGTLFLVLAAAVGVRLLWREQQSRFFRSQQESIVERALMSERLDVLSRYANDILIWADQPGRIQDANERAILTYGYERERLLAMNIGELVPLKSRAAFEREWIRTGEEYGLVLDVRHQRKDGSEFPVQMNVHQIVLGKAVSRQCTILDISERERTATDLLILSSIVESTDDAIISKTLDGVVLSWNKGAERVYGYTAAERIGRSITALVLPRQEDEFPRIVQLLTQGTSVEHFEAEHLRKDGKLIVVSITASALRDKTNRVTGVSVIARDITDRKRAETKLGEANRRTNLILECISDGFNSFDLEGRYTYVNKPGASLIGKRPEELLGKRLVDVFPAAEQGPFGEAFRRAIAQGSMVQVEAFYPEPLNRWYDVRCYPSVEGIVLMYSDTTERRISQRALEASEERYRSLAIATTQIVWTSGPTGDAADDIPMWRDFTGQSREEIMGRGRFDAVHPDEREAALNIWDKAERNRRFFQLEYRLRRHDGEYRWLSSHGVPVIVEGKVREWIGTCTDITERRQAEQEIQSLNQHLEQSVLERTAQLKQSNDELQAFAYSVSHDLRAPLRAVDGFSRILLEDFAPELSPEARRYLEMTHRNAIQMGELIDGLLRFSRLSRQTLSKQAVIPHDLVNQAWEDLYAERSGRTIELTIGSLALCRGDPLLLRQVFVNLLSNAIKYTRRKEISRIEIGTTSPAESGAVDVAAEQTVYFVRDNGVGFDSRYRHKLFGVFQRLHRAEDFEGSGVGLATVQRIVQRHGGQIWANSVPDEGAVFYFTVPEEKLPEGDPNRGR